MQFNFGYIGAEVTGYPALGCLARTVAPTMTPGFLYSRLARGGQALTDHLARKARDLPRLVIVRLRATIQPDYIRLSRDRLSASHSYVARHLQVPQNVIRSPTRNPRIRIPRVVFV